MPLAAAAGGALVAVAEPSEGRFGAVRARTGEQTRFVVIAERTFDALLGSRIFGERAPAAAPAVVRGEAAAIRTVAPAPPIPQAPSPPAPDCSEQTWPQLGQTELVEAVVAALERRTAQAEAPAARHETGERAAPVEELVSQIDAAARAWSSLRVMFDSASPELEAAQRSLRETKEQLSVAHAEIDQHQRRLRVLETELAETRSLLSEAKLRVQETAEALDVGASRLEESRNLL